MRLSLIIITTWFSFTIGLSQHLTYQLHHTDIGLDNIEVRAICYADNRLYIHSDKLYSYDGYSLTTLLDSYNTQGRMLDIIPSEKGQILVLFDAPSIYFSEDTLIQYPEVILKNNASICKIDTTQIYFKSSDSIYYFDERKLKFISTHLPKNLGPDSLFINRHGHFTLSDTYISRSKIEPSKLSIYQNSTQKELLTMPGGVHYHKLPNKNSRYLYIQDSLLISTDLIESDSIALNSLDHRIDTSCILNTAINKNIGIIINKKENRRHYFQIEKDGNVSNLGKFKKYLHGNKIISNSNLWGYAHEGLYEINPSINFFDSETPGLVNAIHSVIACQDGSIYVGGYGDGITRYSDGVFTKLPNLDSTGEKMTLPGAIAMPDTTVMMITSGPKPFLTIKNGVVKKRQFALEDGTPVNDKGYFIDTLQSGQLIIGMQNLGLGIVNEITDSTLQIKSIGEKKGNFLTNVLTATEDHSGKIWMGRTSKGVAVYLPEADTAYTFLKAESSLKIGAISSELDDQGNLWLGTNLGLYFLKDPSGFDPELSDFDSSCRRINLPDGYKEIITIVKKWNNYLLVGGKKAIYFLDLDRFYQNDQPSYPYTNVLFFNQDLQGDGADQNTITIDEEDNIWIGCQSGLIKINTSSLVFDTAPIKIMLKEVESGGSKIKITNNIIEVPNDNRNLQVTYGPVKNPWLKRNIFFDYSIISDSGDTLIADQYTQDLKITIPYIPPDNYTLKVSARKNGIVQHSLKTKIYVPITLLETTWFWVALFATLAGLLYLIANSRNERLNSQLLVAKLNQEKESLSVQAIISSFNPHFINNSLHWIQSRYRNDPELVSLISKLSENIRNIFMKTRQGVAVHSLSEELLIVENYVAVQNLRFNNKINLKLPNEDLLKKHLGLNLILLQIQIHVENAIEHGLNLRKNASKVEIAIEENATELILSVIDDGGGRPLAKALQSEGTQQGSLMLNQLQKIFNQKNKRKMTTRYFDNIYSENEGKSYGTKVSIIIPKNFNYAL